MAVSRLLNAISRGFRIGSDSQARADLPGPRAANVRVI